MGMIAPTLCRRSALQGWCWGAANSSGVSKSRFVLSRGEGVAKSTIMIRIDDLMISFLLHLVRIHSEQKAVTLQQLGLYCNPGESVPRLCPDSVQSWVWLWEWWDPAASLFSLPLPKVRKKQGTARRPAAAAAQLRASSSVLLSLLAQALRGWAVQLRTTASTGETHPKLFKLPEQDAAA